MSTAMRARLQIPVFLVPLLTLLVSPSALAITAAVGDLETKLPDSSSVNQVAKSIVGLPYIESLKAAASNFRDYQCYCQLFAKKEKKWKDEGGANIYFKQQELMRAEIKSSDYRNGAVIVKQPDGKIRGKGGGALSLMKMTIQPDSRTIRLPTGFSIVKSDFVSLYDALKQQLASGGEAVASSAPVSIPMFKDPVLVLILRNKSADKSIAHIIYLDPKTKLPIAWNTFTDGESHAFVFFDRIDGNKGLTEDLFKL